ncbi:CMD domain protein [uncultured Ramlibacter sp.]|uniref:CMD domain protein n=1 Tax=uncultured Ramlibacter sp. TaxID=260755 RepID=UPI00263537FC|nr:CMD domain protein [uncultured Ramlibacter sp.]
MSQNPDTDTIDTLAGIGPGSALARLRAQRPQVREFLQGSDDALLRPTDWADLPAVEREAVALRVAVLNHSEKLAARHRAALQKLDVDQATLQQIEAPKPSVAPRLKALLAHTDLLTLRPRDAKPAHLQALRDQGLSDRAIVSLAQLVSYASFQVRLLAGLKALAGEAA